MSTASDLSAARTLITASLPSEARSDPHPSLRPYREPTFSSAITEAHTHLSSNTPSSSGGIDLSRYEAPEAPDNTTSNPSALKSAWTSSLTSAQTSSTYLSARLTNLSLLETYGKNAWLVSNAQLEDVLSDIEREVSGVREEKEDIELAMRGRLEGLRAEEALLEESWRRGVGRVVETRVAGEAVREEIFEVRRKGARD